MDPTDLFVYGEKVIQLTWRAGPATWGKCLVRLVPQGANLKIEVEHQGDVEVDSHVPSL